MQLTWHLPPRGQFALSRQLQSLSCPVAAVGDVWPKILVLCALITLAMLGMKLKLTLTVFRLNILLKGEVSGDKHHLRKSADRKAQIRKAVFPLTGLICAFRSADFLRWCLSPERNLMHNLFFYFQ